MKDGISRIGGGRPSEGEREVVPVEDVVVDSWMSQRTEIDPQGKSSRYINH